MTALEVSGAKISMGLKVGMPPYAQANILLWVTETVEVEGAMLEETMQPASCGVVKAKERWASDQCSVWPSALLLANPPRERQPPSSVASSLPKRSWVPER